MWKANKFVNISLWILALISVILCLWVFIQCGRLNAVTQKAEMMAVINPMLIWSYILVGIAAVLTIFLPIPQVIENPKSAIGIAIGLLAFIVVIAVSYFFASGEQLTFTPGHAPVSEGTIKFADVNLISVYIMLFATILVTVGASIVNILKMR
jgi:glucan phosphoethanolaminetransferase (alkaline phosphatase superfamily)